MHSPEVVAIEILRPWPVLSSAAVRTESAGRIQIRYSWRKWYDFRPRVFMAFWRLGRYKLYWPGLITVWHIEPDGADALTVCKRGTRWKWHVHHWRVQVHPLQHLRRWALTRCEWCGGRSLKGDVVNHSKQWDRDRDGWWRGERGLFHGDCSTIQTAHSTCVCDVPVLAHPGYGHCAVCNLYRGWRSPDEASSPRDATTVILQSIPAGDRDPAKYAQVVALWDAHRANARHTRT